MYRKIKILGLIIFVISLLLSVIMTALYFEYQPDAIGEGGIIAIPFILILFILFLIADLYSITFLLRERPRGKQIILPLLLLLASILPVIGLYLKSQSNQKAQEKHWSEISLSKSDAYKLIDSCQVERIAIYYNNHPSLKIYGSYSDKYIFQSDLNDISKRLQDSRMECKNIQTR